MKAEMVQRFLEQVITEKEPIREIRIRIGKPVFVLDSEGEKILNFDEKSGNRKDNIWVFTEAIWI